MYKSLAEQLIILLNLHNKEDRSSDEDRDYSLAYLDISSALDKIDSEEKSIYNKLNNNFVLEELDSITCGDLMPIEDFLDEMGHCFLDCDGYGDFIIEKDGKYHELKFVSFSIDYGAVFIKALKTDYGWQNVNILYKNIYKFCETFDITHVLWYNK